MPDDPSIVAPLVDALCDGGAESLWRADDLAAIWKHQLRRTLELELGEWLPDALRQLRTTAAGEHLNQSIAAALQSAPAVVTANAKNAREMQK